MERPVDQWFLLRGLTRESGHWGNFPRLLEMHFPAARVQCLEIPGNGKYCQMKSPASISEMTDWIRTDFAKTNEAPTNGRRFLLAISMGGMIAVDWVSRYPRDFSGLVLINTSFNGVSPLHKRLRPQSYRAYAKILTAFSDESKERAILDLTSNLAVHRGDIVDYWARIQKQRPVTKRNLFRQLLAAATYRAPEEKPRSPLLLFSSLRDRLVDPSCTEAIAKKWAGEHHQHATAGHDLPLDDPQWLLKHIELWEKTIT